MEHGVRRAEQAAEHHEQRERQPAAERDRAYLPQPPTAGQLTPSHVAADEGKDTDPRAHGGVKAGVDVVPRLAPAQSDPLNAQEGDREDDRQADRVERPERARVPGDEVRADKERSRREPGGVGADQHAVATHQRRRRPDQPGGADESIEPPGHGAQQGVTRHSKSSARAENLEAEPRPAADGAHPAAASGSPPKRRSRARNSATAAASSAAPKSGHIVSVKYSSAYAHSHSRKSDSRCSPPVRIRRSTSGRTAPAPIAQREE